ncbi:MAG: M20/M25/M40 family metallo-hydrolase, partial [Eubacteriales bacterium]|nr:M20/M25/M40 family metallo-hydrolase [Eubacteriales bacterium]
GNDKELAVELIRKTADKIKKEYAVTDPAMVIDAAVGDSGNNAVYNAETTSRIILALTHIQDGVVKMSNDIKGLVQTSLNLGVIKENEDEILLTYLLRSSVESEKEYLIAKMQNFAEVIGCEVTLSGTYPAWEYKQDSRLRGIMSDAYERLTGKKPQIQAIHAGVECGMIAEKVSYLDCVSFGPEIIDIHTPKERLSISSVERTWKLILEVLKNL